MMFLFAKLNQLGQDKREAREARESLRLSLALSAGKAENENVEEDEEEVAKRLKLKMQDVEVLRKAAEVDSSEAQPGSKFEDALLSSEGQPAQPSLPGSCLESSSLE